METDIVEWGGVQYQSPYPSPLYNISIHTPPTLQYQSPYPSPLYNISQWERGTISVSIPLPTLQYQSPYPSPTMETDIVEGEGMETDIVDGGGVWRLIL